MTQYMKLFWMNISEIRWILILPFFAVIYGLLNRTWFNKKPYIWELPIDRKIPVIPWTVYIYHTWFPLMIVVFYIMAIFNKPVFYHLVRAYSLGSVLCFLVFLFFQNEVPRHDRLEGPGFARSLLRSTRLVDNPYNGFPSIHVFTSSVCVAGLIAGGLNPIFTAVSVLWFILIIITTVTTKQHVVIDIPGGILFAAISWFLIK